MEPEFETQSQSESNQIHGEVWVHDFTPESALSFRKQVLKLSRIDENMPIAIRINSYGGFVDSLASMIETMDEVPNRFITIVQGCAMSCGAILLSHGDLRFCGKYSRVMVHNIISGDQGDITSLRANADESERLNKIFLGLLAKNCGMEYAKLQDLIKASTDSKDLYMGAEEALEFGLVDRVGIPEIIPIVNWACEAVPPKVRLTAEDINPEPKKKKAPAKKKAKKKSK